MSRILTAIFCGLLFGAGLVISDMINPARVLAFLDVAGAWDPSLGFVMGGALVPSSIAYLIRRHRTRPVFDTDFHVPANRAVDTRLVIGAALFGAGWGLVGLCPGPALAGLVSGKWQIGMFAAFMLAGMVLYRLAYDRSVRATA
jgi:uncharacterized protein